VGGGGGGVSPRHAKANTPDDYEGLLVEPATAGAVGRQLQSALTKDVELVKHDELVAELVKLHHSMIGVGSRTGRSSRARPRYGSQRGLRQRAG
jgi:hypothetical protein